MLLCDDDDDVVNKLLSSDTLIVVMIEKWLTAVSCIQTQVYCPLSIPMQFPAFSLLEAVSWSSTRTGISLRCSGRRFESWPWPHCFLLYFYDLIKQLNIVITCMVFTLSYLKKKKKTVYVQHFDVPCKAAFRALKHKVTSCFELFAVCVVEAGADSRRAPTTRTEVGVLSREFSLTTPCLVLLCLTTSLRTR